LVDGFVNRFKANKSIWPVIDKIREKSRIGLLTNLYPGMLDAIRVRNILPDVKWDVIVDSSVVGLRKPDLEIYQKAQEDAGVKGEEILFIDNSFENIKVAKDLLGWRVFLYDPSKAEDSSSKLSKFWVQER
jgi:FMN phosphatase YigB (HAD superfamily)